MLGIPVSSEKVPKIFISKLGLITKCSIGMLYVCNVQVSKAKNLEQNLVGLDVRD